MKAQINNKSLFFALIISLLVGIFIAFSIKPHSISVNYDNENIEEKIITKDVSGVFNIKHKISNKNLKLKELNFNKNQVEIKYSLIIPKSFQSFPYTFKMIQSDKTPQDSVLEKILDNSGESYDVENFIFSNNENHIEPELTTIYTFNPTNYIVPIIEDLSKNLILDSVTSDFKTSNFTYKYSILPNEISENTYKNIISKTSFEEAKYLDKIYNININKSYILSESVENEKLFSILLKANYLKPSILPSNKSLVAFSLNSLNNKIIDTNNQHPKLIINNTFYPFSHIDNDFMYFNIPESIKNDVQIISIQLDIEETYNPEIITFNSELDSYIPISKINDNNGTNEQSILTFNEEINSFYSQVILKVYNSDANYKVKIKDELLDGVYTENGIIFTIPKRIETFKSLTVLSNYKSSYNGFKSIDEVKSIQITKINPIVSTKNSHVTSLSFFDPTSSFDITLYSPEIYITSNKIAFKSIDVNSTILGFIPFQSNYNHNVLGKFLSNYADISIENNTLVAYSNNGEYIAFKPSHIPNKIVILIIIIITISLTLTLFLLFNLINKYLYLIKDFNINYKPKILITLLLSAIFFITAPLDLDNIQLTVLSDINTHFIIYYDTGKGFNQTDIALSPVIEANTMSTIKIPLNKSNIKNIRILLGSTVNSKYKIKDITINNFLFNIKKYRGSDLETSFNPIEGIKVFQYKNEAIHIETKNKVAYFGFINPISNEILKLRLMSTFIFFLTTLVLTFLAFNKIKLIFNKINSNRHKIIDKINISIKSLLTITFVYSLFILSLYSNNMLITVSFLKMFIITSLFFIITINYDIFIKNFSSIKKIAEKDILNDFCNKSLINTSISNFLSYIGLIIILYILIAVRPITTSIFISTIIAILIIIINRIYILSLISKLSHFSDIISKDKVFAKSIIITAILITLLCLVNPVLLFINKYHYAPYIIFILFMSSLLYASFFIKKRYIYNSSRFSKNNSLYIMIALVIVYTIIRIIGHSIIDVETAAFSLKLQSAIIGNSSISDFNLIQKITFYVTKIFGYNNFILQLPSFIYGIAFLLTMYSIGLTFNKATAIVISLLSLVSPLVYIASKSVMPGQSAMLVIALLTLTILITDKYIHSNKKIFSFIGYFIFSSILYFVWFYQKSQVIYFIGLNIAILSLLFFNLIKNKIKNNNLIISYFVMSFLLMIIFPIILGYGKLSSLISSSFLYINTFFRSGSITPWHFFTGMRLSTFVIAPLFLIPVALGLLKNNKIRIIYGMFITLSIYYILIPASETNALFLIYPLFIILFSLSLTSASDIVQNKSISNILLVLFLFSFINLNNISYSINPKSYYFDYEKSPKPYPSSDLNIEIERCSMHIKNIIEDKSFLLFQDKLEIFKYYLPNHFAEQIDNQSLESKKFKSGYFIYKIPIDKKDFSPPILFIKDNSKYNLIDKFEKYYIYEWVRE